jgi:ribosomal protein S18 acetylase RimI-like enzyme
MEIEVVEANMAEPADAQSVVDLIDAYAADPMGRGEALRAEIRDRLRAQLRDMAGALALLARLEGRAVGVAVCFAGYSTFEARPLLNIHDFAVLPGARGRGVGRALLRAVEAEARRRGCCRISLEVREDNQAAQALYDSEGYGSGPVAMAFWSKEID